MAIEPSEDLRKLIAERMQSGAYQSEEQVLVAALRALEQQESFGDFEAGELDRLLAEGEASMKADGCVDAGQVMARLREQGARRRDGA